MLSSIVCFKKVHIVETARVQNHTKINNSLQLIKRFFKIQFAHGMAIR